MTESQGPARYGVDDPVPMTFLGSLIFPFWSGRARIAAGAVSGDPEHRPEQRPEQRPDMADHSGRSDHSVDEAQAMELAALQA
ncbi:MAG: hypothetical protein B7Y36_00020 [Novosphingobium sp. 28-62-57]|uniref:hypothetical protein n=1 Tax=unclassified Novosphingobium TaxID=2644732 RepID=UPI000BCB1E53|nr:MULTISPECIES: hypothetical protein [unclassified Novosphingobium]OYZ11991.1 MAG: hypothetical protein B7Y36_00020 [Novosphingobium sp. 28-62-57]HQS71136.1 hypothetical protein [Novosphingobium sp.]